MQHQPGIQTISRVAPPSYEEATHPNPMAKDNEYVPPHRTQTHDQHPQVPPFSPSVSGYPQHTNVYASGGVQPASTTIFVSNLPDHQNPVVPVQCIVQGERVVYTKRSTGGDCIRKFISAVLITFTIILIIRAVVFLSMY